MTFSLLNEEECEVLARKARLIYAEDETYLFREGFDGPYCYVVVNGFLEVSRRSRKGWIGTIKVVGAGDTVGEVNLLEKKPSPINVQAYGDVLLLRLDAAFLIDMVEKSPRLTTGLVRTLSRRVNQYSMFFVNAE